MRTLLACTLVVLSGVSASQPTVGQARPDAGRDSTTGLRSATLSGLRFRSIGPALTSGRVSDIAIHPSDLTTWYIGAASGGIWKTENAGTTWRPIFDDQGSYAIGALAIDPSDPLTIWAGTGENNSQRAVGYGDGVYKSQDGGRTWKNVGLKASGHIGRIAIDATNGNVVYVAAQGPLWTGGGERGVYKTMDGGATWALVLAGDNEWTGANEVHLDPRNPKVLYAVMWQRFRRQWGFIDGGPGSGIQKSTDGGATWAKLTRGLPRVDLGKIGFAVSPVDPTTLYAVIEAANRSGGFYRSLDGGSSWRRMNSYTAGPPFYYHELIPDPVDVERVYSVDVQIQFTADSGRSFSPLPGRGKHVDHHALWIDPTDHRHLITGNDGGLYESFDRGATWRFTTNLPLTQFYKVALDSATPFYGVYGGTQDNNTLGGPSRTAERRGIANEDWFVVTGGDGFQPRVDPTDPNILYGESQHGVLVRLDRRTGERINIQPQPDSGDAPLRWNWDSPLIISPHLPSRLYFASQRLFRSDDRGDTWRPLSGDLTRQLNRNELKMMGRIWGVDAVAKNTSTSFYGGIVVVEESPRVEGLLYVGTDDGLIQVSEDGGGTWRRVASFPSVPDTTFVSDIVASRHEDGTVYATFNNHKAGDFKPYVLKSTDRGATWTAISGNLPARGSVWTLAEDHQDKDLLFVGTEFGVFVSLDAGTLWTQLRGGLPLIPVRDIAIQTRHDDLVLATFGRGFYILDDYSPLRRLQPALLASEAALLPVKPAPMFVPSGMAGGSLGASFFTTPNPPSGATFTFYLKDTIRSQQDARRSAERTRARRGEDTPYPSWDSLRAEAREEAPVVQLIITDEAGSVIRKLTAPTGAGLHRVTWDLRWPSAMPASAPRRGGDDDEDDGPAFRGGGSGPYATPGNYRVQLVKRVNGITTAVGEPQPFSAQPVLQASLPQADRAELLAFQLRTARLQRAVLGAAGLAGEVTNRLEALKRALEDTPGADSSLRSRARALELRLAELRIALTGDPVVSGENEPTLPGIQGRVQNVIGGHWNSTSPATATQRRNYEIAAAEFTRFLGPFRSLVETDLKALEAAAEVAGAPWTPGRMPTWP